MCSYHPPPSQFRETALLVACYKADSDKGFTEMAKALLKAGASPNMANKVRAKWSCLLIGYTALPGITFLPTTVLSIAKGGITACICICKMGNADLFQPLIKCGHANFHKVNHESEL